MRQLQFTRSLRVFQPSVSTKSDVINAIANPESVSNVEELSHYKSLDKAEFQALGNPPSIMSVNSPPSVPIYIRRGSLLTVYGVNSSPVKSISSTIEFLNPIKRLILGSYASSYQRLISTTPFSILISSKHRGFGFFGNNENKSFATLHLDGSNDWAVLGKDSLQVFTGNALNVNISRIPKNISKKLAKSLNLPPGGLTGLYRWNKSGYTLLSGRGQVGLVGYGSLYNINLSAKEEVLVNRNNLLAISVNGPDDLQNCVVKYSFSPIDEKQEKSKQSRSTTKNLINRFRFNNVNLNSYLVKIKKFCESFLSFTRSAKNASFNTYLGNQDFVKIIGPRNILLQSNTPNLNLTKPVKSFDVPIQQPKKTKEVVPKTSDYLNVVTIQPGKGAIFESTPDFKETIDKIEKRS